MTSPITKAEIEQALRRPGDFGYFGANEGLFRTWSIGPVIRCRDSDPGQLRTAESLEASLLANKKFKDEWHIERFNHWAVGWVENLTFRVLDDDGRPTAIFKRLHPVLCKWRFLKK